MALVLLLISTASNGKDIPVVIAIYGSPPHVWYNSSSGQVVGMTPERFKTLFRGDSRNFAVEFKLGSFERMAQLLLSGGADLMIALPNSKLDAGAVRLAKIKELKILLWSLRERPSADDFRPLIATTRSYTRILESPVIESLYPGARGSILDSTVGLVRLLITERVDAVISLEDALSYRAYRQGYETSKFRSTTITKIPLYIWASRGSLFDREAEHWRKVIAKQLPEKEMYKTWDQVVDKADLVNSP